MPGKPLIFRAMAALQKLVGPDFFLAWQAQAAALSIKMSAGPALRRNLRRIIAWSGKTVGADAVEELLRQTGRLYAESQVDLYSLEVAARTKAAGVDAGEALVEIRSALARGKGAILATAHYGNLPLALAALSAAGVRVHVLVVSAGPYQWVGGVCENLRFLQLGQAAAACLAALRANETVMIYADLDFFPGNETRDFFGAPVRAPHGASRLSQASGAPMIPTFAVYEEGRHRLACQPALWPDALGEDAQQRALLAAMERQIAAHPEQWFIFRDPWDLAAADAQNRRHLRRLRALT